MLCQFQSLDFLAQVYNQDYKNEASHLLGRLYLVQQIEYFFFAIYIERLNTLIKALFMY